MAVSRHFVNVMKLLYTQSLVGLVMFAVTGLLYGWSSAVSILLGAAIAVLSNAYFAFKFLLGSGWNASAIVRAFYLGEAGKLMMTAALFFLALQIPSVNFLTLMTGFVVVLSVQWFALLYWRG